jgi:hypothetical protein
MMHAMGRRRLQILLAPTEASAFRLARHEPPAGDPDRKVRRIIERARAVRIEAAITQAESELLKRRARRIAAGTRRRMWDLVA